VRGCVRCRTRHLEGRIIETSYSGKIELAMIEQLRRDIEPLLRLYPGADWLIDTTHATGIKPAPSNVSNGMLETFQSLGGRRIAAVITSSPMRMLGSALAFGSKADIKLFGSRDEALRYLRT
jgi:hypothetical protein